MGIETAIGAALIPAVVGGVSSIAGGTMTNETNRDIAKDNNATMIELANTAHQREVKDLRSAGLNPILSSNGNGASSPTMQAPVIKDVLGDAMREGITNFSALQSARQYDPQIDKVKSEAALNKALALKAAADTSSAVAVKNNVEAKTVQERLGPLGKMLGSRASEYIETSLDKIPQIKASDLSDSFLTRKLKDIISGINVNSAAKQHFSSRPRVSPPKCSWSSKDATGAEHLSCN